MTTKTTLCKVSIYPPLTTRFIRYNMNYIIQLLLKEYTYGSTRGLSQVVRSLSQKTKICVTKGGNSSRRDTIVF